MSHGFSSSRPTENSPKLPPWLIVVLLLGLIGFSWWQNRQARLNVPPSDDWAAQNEQHSPQSKQEASEAPEQPTITSEQASTSAEQPLTSREISSAPDEQPAPRASKVDRHTDSMERQVRAKDQIARPKSEIASRDIQIENQTIRDQDGRVIYRGTIDLQPTLDRIERGDKNSHRNDGTTFQNRERKLPQKPSGYYREYVHPTPKSSGPGPQRIIVGKDGDVWYTPDHYKSFKKIK